MVSEEKLDTALAILREAGFVAGESPDC
ncbi:hypothetical protein SAMN05446037_10431 [Anaerovirgula multivorans]|nr:hypothetical protein SAMN05446037_1003315 [Anaerovirgula multivorans]SNT13166.1 hypothetical protein SAMN05446037_10431 [Anaerovirgula multivorans]